MTSYNIYKATSSRTCPLSEQQLEDLLEIIDEGGSGGGPTLPVVSIGVSPGSVSESSGQSLVYTFSRSGPTTDSLLVSFTVSGTAQSGADYIAFPTTISIPSGSSTATLGVLPVFDNTTESSETLILTISPSSAYNITTSTATGVIINSTPTPVGGPSWFLRWGGTNPIAPAGVYSIGDNCLEAHLEVENPTGDIVNLRSVLALWDKTTRQITWSSQLQTGDFRAGREELFFSPAPLTAFISQPSLVLNPSGSDLVLPNRGQSVFSNSDVGGYPDGLSIVSYNSSGAVTGQTSWRGINCFSSVVRTSTNKLLGVAAKTVYDENDFASEFALSYSSEVNNKTLSSWSSGGGGRTPDWCFRWSTSAPSTEVNLQVVTSDGIVGGSCREAGGDWHFFIGQVDSAGDPVWLQSYEIDYLEGLNDDFQPAVEVTSIVKSPFDSDRLVIALNTNDNNIFNIALAEVDIADGANPSCYKLQFTGEFSPPSANCVLSTEEGKLLAKFMRPCGPPTPFDLQFLTFDAPISTSGAYEHYDIEPRLFEDVSGLIRSSTVPPYAGFDSGIISVINNVQFSPKNQGILSDSPQFSTTVNVLESTSSVGFYYEENSSDVESYAEVKLSETMTFSPQVVTPNSTLTLLTLDLIPLSLTSVSDQYSPVTRALVRGTDYKFFVKEE